MRYETEEFHKRYDAEKDREHGPDDTLVEYSKADGALVLEDELCMALSEAEDFEREMDIKIEADTLQKPLFDWMVKWCGDNGLLKKRYRVLRNIPEVFEVEATSYDEAVEKIVDGQIEESESLNDRYELLAINGVECGPDTKEDV